MLWRENLGAFYCGVALLIIEAAFAFKFWRHVRSLQGARRWDGTAYTSLSPARLQMRLKFLVGKYAEHAQGWQFVLWARQVLLAASTVAPSFGQRGASVPVASSPQDSVIVPLQCCFALMVLFTTLTMHTKTQPYAHRYQNRLEAALSVNGIWFVCVGLFWFYLQPMTGSFAQVVEGALLLGLFSPLALLLGWSLDKSTLALGVRRRPAEIEDDGLLGDEAEIKGCVHSMNALPLRCSCDTCTPGSDGLGGRVNTAMLAAASLSMLERMMLRRAAKACRRCLCLLVYPA